jgi:hypothetical protein
VELRSSDGVPVRVSATDACGNGCYLQTMATVCVGTQFTATFCIEDQRIRCECTVRTSDPGLGMGVEFTGLDSVSRLELQTWLERHCSSRCGNRRQRPDPSVESSPFARSLPNAAVLIGLAHNCLLGTRFFKRQLRLFGFDRL